MTGITRKTLFYYDRIGLLTPSRRSGTQQFKLYDREKKSRLEKILEYRKAGLSISEIRALLDDKHADRLKILNDALIRLLKEKDDVEQEIQNLEELITVEKKLAGKG
ncbi:MAG: MerR family transcriptional regulator [Eubacterium sp.]|nr:MerR family transcriptional regulator [Eubacterium sp.]